MPNFNMFSPDVCVNRFCASIAPRDKGICYKSFAQSTRVKSFTRLTASSTSTTWMISQRCWSFSSSATSLTMCLTRYLPLFMCWSKRKCIWRSSWIHTTTSSLWTSDSAPPTASPFRTRFSWDWRLFILCCFSIRSIPFRLFWSRWPIEKKYVLMFWISIRIVDFVLILLPQCQRMWWEVSLQEIGCIYCCCWNSNS